LLSFYYFSRFALHLEAILPEAIADVERALLIKLQNAFVQVLYFLEMAIARIVYITTKLSYIG
jgi:hypothetical protein